MGNMNEFVTANGTAYECKSVTTGLDSISFTVTGHTANDMTAAFSDVSEITVSYPGEEQPHGTFEHLKLESVTTNVDDGSVTVTMHIKNEVERRLDDLEEGREIQNGAIADLGAIYGGEA